MLKLAKKGMGIGCLPREYCLEELADGELFLSKAVDIFHRMKPYNDYLNRALVEFKMPER